MDQYLDKTQNTKDFNSFFGSFFTDLGRTVSRVRDLVLTLINVNLPSLPDIEIGNDMLSIVSACHKTYNDLKKVESLLRGHVQAKQIAKTSKSRVTNSSPIHQSIIERNSSISWSQGPSTPFFSKFKKSSQFAQTKQESTTTYVSSYTDQQSNSNKNKNKGLKVQKMIETEMTLQTDTNFHKIKENDFKKEHGQSENQLSDRVKSVEVVKKIDELRQIESIKIKNFEHSNQQCLRIIRQLKEEVNKKSSKLKRKINK